MSDTNRDRLNEKESTKRINPFLKKNVNKVLSQTFGDDYKIQKSIACAANMSEIKEIDRSIKSKREKNELPTENGTNEKLLPLVKELNTYAGSLHNPSETKWFDIRRKIVNYFSVSSEMRIYAGYHKKGYKGYFLDTRSGALTHDGNPVCQFDMSTDGAKLKELFPNVFAFDKGRKDWLLGRPKSNTLTSDKLIALINLAHEKNPNAPVHPPVTKDFMSLFSQLKKRAALANEMKELGENTGKDLKTYVDEAITNIEDGIDEYLDKHPQLKTENPKKYNLLMGTKEYFATGNLRAFEEVVKNNKRSWSEKNLTVYSNTGDKVLNIVKQMQTSKKFQSELVKRVARLEEARNAEAVAKENAIQAKKDEVRAQQEAIKAAEEAKEAERQVEAERARTLALEKQVAELTQKIAELTQTDNSEYDAHAKEIDEQEEKVRVRWQQYKVTADAFETSMDKMIAKLEGIKDRYSNEGLKLPEVSPLPEKGVNDNDDSSVTKKVVIDHIIDYINKLKTAAKSSTPIREFFESDCALLENQINRFIAKRVDEDDPELYFAEDVQKAYTHIGICTRQTLADTEKQPKKEPEDRVSVVDIRDGLSKVIHFYSEIQKQLSAFKTHLNGIHQTTMHRDITYFVRDELNPKVKELEDALKSLDKLPEKEFNILAAKKTEAQIATCKALDLLESHQDHLINHMSYVLQYKNTFDKESLKSGEPRTFISPDERESVNVKIKGTFNKIMADVKTFLNGKGDEVIALAKVPHNLINHQEPELGSTPAKGLDPKTATSAAALRHVGLNATPNSSSSTSGATSTPAPGMHQGGSK